MPCMNFSDDRESRDSTTPSFGKWISTSSSSTEDQAREGEVVPAALCFLGETPIEDALHPFPNFDRHERFMLALNELAVPFKPAGIEAVAQDSVNRAQRHLRAALGI